MTNEELRKLIGTKYKTKRSGVCKIIDVITIKSGNRNRSRIVLKFLKTGYIKVTTYRQLIDDGTHGGVSDPYYPRVCGVGFIGEGDYNTSSHRRLYGLWLSMLNRAYKHPSYTEISVCSRWLNFQNFAKDIQKKRNWNTPNFELDKDLRVFNCKIYSPKTTSFVPRILNAMCRQGGRGYSYTDWGYRVVTTINNKPKSFGTFKTKKKAKQVYIKVRAEAIYNVALKYKTQLHKEVRANLLDREKLEIWLRTKR